MPLTAARRSSGSVQPLDVEQLEHRRALAAGQHQTLETVESAGRRDLARPSRSRRRCKRLARARRSRLAAPGHTDRGRHTAADLTSRAAASSSASARGRRPGGRASARRGPRRPRPGPWIVPVVGHRAHDRATARRRVVGLEDAAADEHRLGTELHHQRGVGGRRDAAGREVRHRQALVLGDPRDQLDRHAVLRARGARACVAIVMPAQLGDRRW